MASSIVTRRDVSYVAGSDLTGHTLDLYEPQNDPPTGSRFPLVIYIHGGGWTERDKKDYAHIGEECASNNICCAIINYRLSPLTVPQGSEEHFKHPGHTEDCAFALAHLYSSSSSYKYDTEKVTIVGHSAGGFMAALLQFDDHFRAIWCKPTGSLKIQRIIGLQGIYDLPSILSDFGNDYMTYMIAPAFGWNSKTHHDASPTNFVLSLPADSDLSLKASVPWTLIWSDKDTMVNKRQSEEFEQALKQKGVTVNHLILSPGDADAGSHHGVTFKEGFSRYVFPIIFSNMYNKGL